MVVTLFKVLEKNRIHYIAMSPGTWLKLLKERHGIEIGRSWLHQAQKDLVDEKHFGRQRRWNRNDRRYFKRKNGKTIKYEIGAQQTKPEEIHALPSMFAATEKLCRYAISKGIEYARVVLKMITEWRKRGDKRWPTPAEITPGERPSTREEGLAAIGDILKGLA